MIEDLNSTTAKNCVNSLTDFSGYTSAHSL